MAPPTSQIESLHGAAPLTDAARVVLGERLELVAELLERAAHRGATDPRTVHQLRVTTRRAGAALQAFRACLDEREWKKAHKRLRRIRRAAGAARDCDVHGAIFTELRRSEPKPLRPAINRVLRLLVAERAAAQAQIESAAVRYPRARLAKLDRNLLRSLREPRGVGARFSTLMIGARASLPWVVEQVREAALPADALRDIAHLHELRIRVKRLRYALEIFAPCFEPGARADAVALMRDLQDHMGAVNDGDSVVVRLERYAAVLNKASLPDPSPKEQKSGASPRPRVPAPGLTEGVGELLALCRAARDTRHTEFLTWWDAFRVGAFSRTLDRLLRSVDEPSGTGLPASSSAKPEPAPSEGILSASGPNGLGTLPEHGSPRVSTEPQPAHHRPAPERLAAIDVGTNSIRLIVAEATRDGDYRVLDDEKETTRLGQGLAATGLMSPEAIDRSVQAVARMKGIAEGYGAGRLRIVGTAVVREAINSSDFVGRLREATGLNLEVISAEEEARLAYLSAAHAFDLSDIDAAVADIGGGSMEVVLSSSGVVERVFTTPLGAVRLTERFGGAEKAAGERFDEMRTWIKQEIKQTIGKPPFTPQVLIGAGGTLSTLAVISMQMAARASGVGGAVIAPAALRGHEMKRSEVMHLIERLRDMPLKERARVPGLPPERADIIIAGLTAAERLMKRLGVNRLRAHDGGIRDGLLLTMARELCPSPAPSGAPARVDRLASVRKFADICDFDRRHCDHVATLALRIYDQLATLRAGQEEWAESDRTLLEAAAILHDVGYHINYTKHHLHSYHLIVHADLRGFTSREIGVVANVARYHRRAEPKMKHPGFARLAEKDRELVRRLTAILRVADGLDRTHTQRVGDVNLIVRGDVARFIVQSTGDPGVDVWGAEQKRGLFQQVFGQEPRFEWTPADPDTPPPAAPPARRNGVRPETRSAAKAPAPVVPPLRA